MAWGGARPGAGRKRSGDARKANPTRERTPATTRLTERPPAAPTVPAEPKSPAIDPRAWAAALPELERISKEYAIQRPRTPANSPFKLPVFPKAAVPPNATMAMDEALVQTMNGNNTAWLSGEFGEMAGEGLMFPGYAFLSELAQRPEYRVMGETIADDATRKWISFDVVGDENTQKEERARDPEGYDERIADPDEQKKRVEAAGKTDRVKELKDDQERLEVKHRFYEQSRNGSFMGRSHLFLDIRSSNDPVDPTELASSIGNGRDETSKTKVGAVRGSFKGLRTIEPVWAYPMAYNAQNPLDADWYNPRTWYVMGRQIDVTRLLPFVPHPVPDMLKPAYAFGGLSLTQMAKPYVDIWLQTRQSVGQLIHSFSVMVLMTDVSTLLSPDNASALLARVAMFNMLRDNQGTFVLNKNTEDFKNVSASLGGLHELQAQAQEHMASICRIPLVKFTGIQPAGLNASSEGEIKVYDDTIGAYQSRYFDPALTRIVNFEMLSLWGEIDPDISHRFEPLREMTQAEKGEKENKDAERNQKYVDMGAIAPGEVRKIIINDPELPYTDLDPEDVPEPPAEQGMVGQGGAPGEAGEADGEEPDADQHEGAADESVIPFARDSALEWREGDHPRAPDGKFGSGGAGGGKAAKSKMPGIPSFLQHKPKTNIGASINPGSMKQVGKQMGSNPGGVFEDGNGKKFYVKKGKTKDHVRNEMTAAALYDLIGTKTLQYRPVDGGTHIATEMSDLDKNNANKFSDAERAEAKRDFAAHAWLANWDAVGMGGDNLGIVRGKPTALDLGGALEFRAQGAPKGSAFGNKVTEIDTLRDKKMNRDTAGVFGDMTPAEMRESARYVTSLSDSAIRKVVEKQGGAPGLAEKLIARRDDIARQARTFGAKGDPRKATSTAVFGAGEPNAVSELNDVPFEEWESAPANDEQWADVEGQADIDEPEFDPGKKDASSGVIIREPDGRVWMVRPSKGYGGYEHTFPKGRAEPGLSLQANAIKEAYEESGLKVRITGFAGDHDGDLTRTRFYYAERDGGDPSKHGWESDGVVLAPRDKLDGFLNRTRDRKIASSIAQDEAPFEESKHPRGPDGKFSSGGGGGGSFTSKKDHIAALMKAGTTIKEVLAATGWPSVSMPQQAAAAGLKLTKVKKDGETLYYGTEMTAEEKTALKSQVKAVQKKKDVKAIAAALPGKSVTALIAAQALKDNPMMAAALSPKFPPPTPAEMEKAKKTVALQLQFVPSAPKDGPMAAMAQKYVDAFNEKWANKPVAPNQIAEKVNDFKTLNEQAGELSKVNEKAKQEIAAQMQKEAAEKAAIEAKKAEVAAAASAKRNENIVQELGISPQAAEAVQGLAKMLGSKTGDLVKTFKNYAAKAAGQNLPISGFQAAILANYSNGGYIAVNQALRSSSWTPQQHLYVALANKALMAMPKHTGLATRGTTLSMAEQQVYANAGTIVQEHALMSTAAGDKSKFNGNTTFKVTGIGKRGASIKGLSHYPGEVEVLFAAKTYFKIDKVVGKPGGPMVVHMTEYEEHI